MKPDRHVNDYDALIEAAHAPPDAAARRDAARLAEIASNLESLAKLVAAEGVAAGAASPATQTEVAPPAGPAGGTLP